MSQPPHEDDFALTISEPSNRPAADDPNQQIERLRSRLPKLLFLSTPASLSTAQTPSVLGKRINQWIENARGELATDPAPAARQQIGVAANTLAEAIEAVLDNPEAILAHVALAQTVDRVMGPAGSEPSQGVPPALQASRPEQAPDPRQQKAPPPTFPPAAANEQPRFEVHRLDEAERAWWASRFERLRRLTMGGFAVGIILMTLSWITPLVEITGDTPTPITAPVAPLEPPPARPPGLMDPSAGESPRLPRDRMPQPLRLLEDLDQRVAELEVELIRLKANLGMSMAETPSADSTPDQVTPESDDRPALPSTP
jgi:hypothetical protein